MKSVQRKRKCIKGVNGIDIVKIGVQTFLFKDFHN